MKYNLAVLFTEWKRGGWSMRYFLGSHFAANVMMIAASTVSIVAGALGSPGMQMLLLGAAVLCAIQAALAWSVLQRRFSFRYSLW